MVHTAHPVTGAKGELFGEVVVGLGEALVGNYPGRALSFKSTAVGEPMQVCNCASKLIAICIISGSFDVELGFRHKLHQQSVLAAQHNAFFHVHGHVQS